MSQSLFSWNRKLYLTSLTFVTLCLNPYFLGIYSMSPNKFDITTLKPFDKVLVRDYDIHRWVNSLYGYCDELYAHKHSCINGYRYVQCIPYEGNEHLLGTNNDCDQYFKTWE